MEARTPLASVEALAPCGTIILGGGPAGTALLLAASRQPHLAAMLQAGLVIVERGPSVGAGALGGYAVTSDSTAETFLTAIDDHPDAALRRLSTTAEVRAIASHTGHGGVPLADVGRFLDLLGGRLSDRVRRGGGQILTGHEALWSTRTEGGWVTRLRRLADGACFDQPCRRLVIATGGEQSGARVQDCVVAGEALGAQCGARLIGADQVLAAGGLAALAARLHAIAAPRLVIVGGSTSAVTAANAILGSSIGGRLGPASLSLLHRRKLRPFYPSAAAALADGFTDFGARDICPVSGFVYRLGGFRTEARALVLASLGIGGRTPDPRLRLHQLATGADAVASAALEEADCVIAAIGYRPRGHDLRARDGFPIALAAAAGGAMVDARCRVLGAGGRPLPGVFGLGLAAGFLPSGPLGGEPSFRGQANGLWLWQNAVGLRIAEQLCASLPRAASARPRALPAHASAPRHGRTARPGPTAPSAQAAAQTAG